MTPQKRKLLLLLAVMMDKLHGDKGERGEKGDKGDKGEDSTVPGPQGERGEKGDPGKDGKDGLNGMDGAPGRDGIDGKDGKDGKKGERGPAGKDAKEVTVDHVLEVTTPYIIQNIQKAVSSKTYSASEIEGLAEYIQSNGEEQTFEKVSKNLKAYPATYTYTGDNLTSIEYDTGVGTVTKTLNYTGENLTSVVLSGSIPSGIDTTKTLTYTGDNLTEVTYA